MKILLFQYFIKITKRIKTLKIIILGWAFGQLIFQYKTYGIETIFPLRAGAAALLAAFISVWSFWIFLGIRKIKHFLRKNISWHNHFIEKRTSARNEFLEAFSGNCTVKSHRFAIRCPDEIFRLRPQQIVLTNHF